MVFFLCLCVQSGGQRTSRHEFSGHMSIKFWAMARWLVFPLFHFQFPASPATSAVGRGRTVGTIEVGSGRWALGSG